MSRKAFEVRMVRGCGITLEPVPLVARNADRPPDEREAAIAAHAARVAAEEKADGHPSRCFACGITPPAARNNEDTFAARRSGWVVRYRRHGTANGAESLCPDCYAEWGWW